MQSGYPTILPILAALCILACTSPITYGDKKMTIEKQDFGKIHRPQGVYLYTMTNKNGLIAKVTDYGAILTELHVPDRDGNLADVVLGYPNLEGYVGDGWKMGATVGRYANRISNASFTIDGTEYKITTNLGKDHIHGGKKGFDDQIWNAEPIESDNAVAVKFSYTSPNGEEGFPGKLDVTVTYTLTNDNELKIDYEATTDKSTVVNLTNHSYFNLAGHDNGHILDHVLTINAETYTDADDRRFPTGQIKSVKDTPIDFTKPVPIGARIKQAGGIYDHNYCITDADGSVKLAARVTEPKSGRVMELYTTQPGVQLFTPNYSGSMKGKDNTSYTGYAAFCLETQHYPDSPNKPNFPSTILRPGEQYKHTAVFKFSIE